MEHITHTILSSQPNTEYFFCLLGPRFQKIIDDYCTKLGTIRSKKLVPLYFSESDNRAGDELFVLAQIHTNQHQYMYYSEELNNAFSESADIAQLIDTLLQRQETIFLLSFTSAFLHGNADRCTILGPQPHIATKYDNKAEQCRLFNQLGIQNPNIQTYTTVADYLQRDGTFPCYMSAAYSSSGVESNIIHSEQQAHDFYENLRPVNKANELCVSRIIPYRYAPNISAIAMPNNAVIIVAITDQILLGNAHTGNIFPSAINRAVRQKIIDATTRIGQAMSQQGFYGLFGCDFLVTEQDEIYAVDLNPRRQGGYLPNYLSSRIDIIDLEIKLALNKDSVQYDVFNTTLEPNYAWVQSKIKAQSEIQIRRQYTVNSVTEPFRTIGSHYITTFYNEHSKNVNTHSLGLYLATNIDREALQQAMQADISKTLAYISA